jgi:hypothetical protein
LLDELTAAGVLTPAQRSQLAAEDGAANLNRLLRRVEIAGHDPKAVLTDAMTSRHLNDARQISNLIHHRISESVSVDPVGDRYSDWVPAVDNPAYQSYLNHLATAADWRRDELSQQVVEQQPQWAIEALGPVPNEEGQRNRWRERAGAVAAHRELTGHDDETTALGAAPKVGQVESYASWRSAWRALDRPDADRAEVEMSDGQLELRIRAYQRETAWPPRYVANELAGTRQAAEHHRYTAATRTAEAADTTDQARRAHMEQEAAEAAALADLLDRRVAELETVDEARAVWWAHTAGTRAAADRAAAELEARRAADGRADPDVTAVELLTAKPTVCRAAETSAQAGERDLTRNNGRDHTAVRDKSLTRNERSQQASDDQADAVGRERTDNDDHEDRVTATASPAPADDRWDAARRAADADEDPHQEIRYERDLADVAQQRAADHRAAEPRPHPDAAETNIEDIRGTAARAPRRGGEDEVRAPTAAETTDSVRRTQRALAEIRARDAADRKREAEQGRSDQLNRWHQRDRAQHARQAAQDHAMTRG